MHPQHWIWHYRNWQMPLTMTLKWYTLGWSKQSCVLGKAASKAEGTLAPSDLHINIKLDITVRCNFPARYWPLEINLPYYLHSIYEKHSTVTSVLKPMQSSPFPKARKDFQPGVFLEWVVNFAAMNLGSKIWSQCLECKAKIHAASGGELFSHTRLFLWVM